MHIISIVGARPQFVKVAVICRAIARWQAKPIRHQIIHTGQHYDPSMSEVFFSELQIPRADYQLNVGSCSHGVQTGEMIKRIEPILMAENPDWVLLYGDTNSTLAGAVTSSKLHLPTAHIEAGLRSFDRRMPEELNRIATDHLSDLLLCPTQTAIENLAREGLAPRAVLTGDVMYDAVCFYQALAAKIEAAGSLRLPAPASESGTFALATVHRAVNTDNLDNLANILRALDRIAAEICPVLLPLHPRTLNVLRVSGWNPENITILPPASFFQMLLMESRARFILTDSGGVQKEAYFMQRPCITLREHTEWVETLESGCNILAGAHEAKILEAARRTASAGPWRNLHGSGDAGTQILQTLISKS
jgi:UDP-GlcNAc3NAcA epimerase